MKKYTKIRHTFPQDPHKNPDGPLDAFVYAGLLDPVEPYANYIIEIVDHKDGLYQLVLERDSFLTDNLTSLEHRLFKWMEDEGVEDYANYTCEACGKKHRNEFSLTCSDCDSDRESTPLDIND